MILLGSRMDSTRYCGWVAVPISASSGPDLTMSARIEWHLVQPVGVEKKLKRPRAGEALPSPAKTAPARADLSFGAATLNGNPSKRAADTPSIRRVRTSSWPRSASARARLEAASITACTNSGGRADWRNARSAAVATAWDGWLSHAIQSSLLKLVTVTPKVKMASI